MKKNIYKFKILKSQKLIHGVSTKFFGSIKDDGKTNKKNLKKFLDALSVDTKSVVFSEQVHGSRVVKVDDSKKQYILNADGLIINKKNVFLGIVTADCLPMIFYDEKMGIVGIAHAGYKGLLKRILKNMVFSFKKLGSDTKDIKVAIGPSIGVCCYDVLYDRTQMFVKSEGDSGRALPIKSGSLARMTNIYQTRKGKYFLDLKNIAKQSLILEGVAENNIEVSDICTKDSKDFFSYRREGPKNFGEFATIVGRV